MMYVKEYKEVDVKAEYTASVTFVFCGLDNDLILSCSELKVRRVK